MGEIKSTLDLAMEKIKNLEITDQDRARIRQESILKKVQGILASYQNDEERKLVKDLDRVPQEERSEVRRALAKLLINNVKLGEPLDNLLEELSQILDAQEQTVLEGLKTLGQEYQEERKGLRSRAESSLKKDLEEKQIRGNAIILKVEGTHLWEEEVEKLEKQYLSKLESLSQAL